MLEAPIPAQAAWSGGPRGALELCGPAHPSRCDSSHPAMPAQGPSGSRRPLLALLVALGWLLALQLLLDLRALGLLCGALAVLGGWLGPPALSPRGRRLRLERFVSSLRAPAGSAADEGRLEKEIASTVRKVVRDFVASWYRTVSREPAFEAEVERAMLGLAAELRRRMRRVDRRALARRLLLLCGQHLQSFLRARDALRADPKGGRTLWREYSLLAGPHPALLSPAAEVGCARAAVDALLRALVPWPHLETRTGRFVVVELVACNVLLPAIRKMSDPDWINLLLIGAFSKKPRGGKLHPAPPVPDSLPFPAQMDTAPTRLPPSPRAAEGLRREAGTAGEEGEEVSRLCHAEGPFLRPQTLGSLFPCEGLELESPAPDVDKDMELLAPSPAGELLDEPPQDPSAPEGAAASEDGTGDLDQGPGPSSDAGLLPTSALSSCPDIQIEPAVEKEEESPAVTRRFSSRRPSSLGRDLGAAEGPAQFPPEPGQSLPLLSSSPTASMSTFSFEPLSSPEGPVVIQNLRITGTITAREHSGTGFHPYTLYTVKVRAPGALTPFHTPPNTWAAVWSSRLGACVSSLGTVAVWEWHRNSCRVLWGWVNLFLFLFCHDWFIHLQGRVDVRVAGWGLGIEGLAGIIFECVRVMPLPSSSV